MDVTRSGTTGAGRRLAAVAAALALAGAAVGCGEKEEPDLSTVPVTTESTTPTVPTTTVPPETQGTGTNATPAP
jgi:hypothetical protein